MKNCAPKPSDDIRTVGIEFSLYYILICQFVYATSVVDQWQREIFKLRIFIGVINIYEKKRFFSTLRNYLLVFFFGISTRCLFINSFYRIVLAIYIEFSQLKFQFTGGNLD